MKLVFVGADHEVTGSCHYLEVAGKHILVDYGMEQGVNVFENVPLPVAESMIDYVFLTHAHVDHSGLLPLLYARGFRGQIYTTDATADLCSIMLRDCAHIQSAEAEWKNRKAKRSANNAVVEPPVRSLPLQYDRGSMRGSKNPFYGYRTSAGLCQHRSLADGGRQYEKNRIFRRYRQQAPAVT